MSFAPHAAARSASGSRSLDTARYQVLERRDVRTAVEFELWIVPAFILAELILFGRTNALFAATTIAALAALGALGLSWRLGRRRRPHPTAFLIGVIIFVVAQDYLSSLTDNWMTLIGLLFVLIVLLFPKGILGMLQRRRSA